MPSPAHRPEPTSSTPGARSVQLSVSGQRARIEPDEHGGTVLVIGEQVQSHVDLARPLEIRYEYLRRMAAVLDAAAAPGAPLRVLHLGAGALTLPRRLAVARPGSEQTVVDLDRELVDFVLAALPLPEGARVESIVGDARAAARELAGQGAAFDAVVLDIGTGEDGAEHLRGSDFYAELLGLLPEDAGTLLVNIGDDDGLRFLAAETVALDWAADDGALLTLADATMLERLELGNAVLAVVRGVDEAAESTLRARLEAAGPHPAAVLDREDSLALAERIAAVGR